MGGHPCTMKISSAVLLALLPFLSGCNQFTAAYKPAAINVELAPYSGKTEVIVCKMKGKFQEDEQELKSHGYVRLGTSSFITAFSLTSAQLRSQGKKVGADIVLFTIEPAGSETINYPASSGDSGGLAGGFRPKPSLYIPPQSEVRECYKYAASFWRNPQGDSGAVLELADDGPFLEPHVILSVAKNPVGLRCECWRCPSGFFTSFRMTNQEQFRLQF
jgi:hypothetical protein